MRQFRYRGQKGVWAVIALLITIVVAYGTQAGWFDQLGGQAAEQQPGLYSVKQFSDGDTIVVDMNGKAERVRFIGVDTPETHKPNAPVQCYGPAAAAFTKRTIGSQRVRLESDPLSTNRDRYDRLLRYVYLPDGTLMNERLIQEGYGFYYPYFPFSKSQQFAAAGEAAQTAHKGVWANCKPTQTDRGGWISNDQGT